MDPDWDEVQLRGLPPPGLRAHTTPASTLSFDTSSELLWVGNEYGRVTSFYSSELVVYTSFRAHTSHDGKVYQLLFTDKGVIALGARSVHMALRTGSPIWHIRHEDMKELRCMTFTSKGTAEILVAGEQDKMFVIDVLRGEVMKQIPTKHKYKIMKRSRYICAATTGSTVHLLDPLTFSIVNIWNTQSAVIHDMDAQHEFIVTCGATPRPQGLMFDLFVNVFDPKNMQFMPPVGFPAGAAFVRMHPRMSSTSLVVSQSGQIHVVDLMNPNTTNIRQANCAQAIMVDIAPSGDAVAIADQAGNIHLWGSHSSGKMVFTQLNNPIETATPEDPNHRMEWSDDVPLNTIGMPFYRDTLASAWPRDAIYEVGAPPPKEDVQLLSSLQRRDWGLYGKNVRGLRRNQTENTRSLGKEQNSLKVPKFLSEQARGMLHSPAGTPAPEDLAPEPQLLLTTAALQSHKDEVPEMYQRLEIQYSKFGIDDFDFGFYNSTQYAGLQNHIDNSYVNALLQIMYFTPAVRNAALQHAATGCFEELCLLCELGFLFDMLSKAEGAPCHASNLLKIFSYHPQAANLGLMDDLPHAGTRTLMLQNFARFILDKIVVDYARIDVPTKMDQLLQTAATSSIRCQACRIETTRDGSSYVHELIYPSNKPGHRHTKASKITFSQALKKSIERETNSKGWCQNCHRYQTIATKKLIHRVPTVLTLLAGNLNDENRRLWATPCWVPEEIGVIITPNPSEFFCYEGDDLKALLQRGTHQIAVYSLTGLAVNIDGASSTGSHLVAMANVAHSAPEAPGPSQWYLLNDFHVKPVPTEEALTFNTTWKAPSVITYELKEVNNKLDSSWKDNLDTSLLYVDLKPNLLVKTYKILNPEYEKIDSNTIIAIDAEFVSISKPVLEIRSEGDYRTIRPTVHALARTSVLRGSGEDEGVPFIDDYVHIKETVVDYLTSFSGIREEDLDPQKTKHNLVPLKIAYKKMWILLNLGCKFLGHGLKQDFRVINMHVPRAQIIDTIDLFFLPSRKRKLSLQFLAWCLLSEDIQQETHDSIEDARTALKLYRKYQEYDNAHVLGQRLHEIYHQGTICNFKPPTRQGQNGQRTDTPPVVDGPTTPQRRTGGGSGSGFSPGYTPGRSIR